jgi:hypothetical protein
METISTLEGQNIWDIAIRYQGNTENLGAIVSQFQDIDTQIPTFTPVEIDIVGSSIVAFYDNSNLQVASFESEVFNQVAIEVKAGYMTPVSSEAISVLDGQNAWDLIIQHYGDTSKMREVISQFSNLDIKIPVFTSLPIVQTSNKIVSLFKANNTAIASYQG